MSDLLLENLVAGRQTFRIGPINLAARPGDLVAIVGPNGVGKSTLLLTMAGLLAPLEGRLARPPGAAALAPPPGALAPPFSAGHVVALGRAGQPRWSPALREADVEAARSAMAALGIENLAPMRFDRLSSGQQQLVMLARLVAQNAPLCLLDEPTALLDLAQAAKVEAAICDLAQSGRIVVLATHDIGLASRTDRVVALGTDVTVGTAPTVLTQERLSRLYGAEISSCAACGHALADSTRASARP